MAKLVEIKEKQYLEEEYETAAEMAVNTSC
jgi:hypothetical protein